MIDSIDTNIVLRYILNDVPEQKKLVIDFLSDRSARHCLSDQALAEIIYVLEKAYNLARDRVVGLVSFFLTRYDGVIEYNHDLTRLTIPMYVAHPKLSWTDCALVAEAETRHREPLFTFDKKLARRLPNARLLE